MQDVADGLLLDVRDFSIADLDLTDEGSALRLSLSRILESDSVCNFNSFSSSI